MLFYPVKYDQPLFRPPGEANSLIIQATLGCTWNECAFCEMYTSKKFKIRKIQEVVNDINVLASNFPNAKKFFIADGNAFVLSYKKLIEIVDAINTTFKKVQRIAAYALPSDILSKTDQELKFLNDSGLKLLYIGIESGDDELLQLVNKNETYQSTLEGIEKAQHAGIDTSIMIINGLGGKNYMNQHAANSAKILNALNPKFLSVLTLTLPYGLDHYIQKFKGEYISMSISELLEELKILIDNLQVNNTIFRTDHISNRLVLKGILPRNKTEFINQIDTVQRFLRKV